MEDGCIRGELHLRATAPAISRLWGIFRQLTTRECCGFGFAIANRLDDELRRKGIDRLGADTVQTYRLLEGLRIILGARVHFGNDIHHLAQGNTSAIVAHGHRTIAHRDLNGLAGAHHEFVDRVVNDFLQKNVDAIIRRRSVAEFADIHPRAKADMLLPFEGSDVVFGVLGSACHLMKANLISIPMPSTG